MTQYIEDDGHLLVLPRHEEQLVLLDLRWLGVVLSYVVTPDELQRRNYIQSLMTDGGIVTRRRLEEFLT